MARTRPLAVLVLLFALLTAAHLLILHQGPRWASPLIMLEWCFNLAFGLLLFACALALGRRLARPLLGLDRDPLVEGLAALGLGLGCLSLAILAAGLLHLYYGVGLLAAALGLGFWLQRELGAILCEVCAWPARWLRAGAPTAPTPGQRLLLVILLPMLAVVAVRDMAPVGSNGPDWDAQVYHLAAPKIYVAAHRFLPLPDHPLANAPSGEEMYFVLGLLAGTDGLGKVLNLLFALGLALAAGALARRHFEPQAAWLAALLVLSTFWLVLIIPTTMTDCAAAFLIVLGASDLMAWASRPARRRALTPGRDDRLLLRAGLLTGFAVSDKLVDLPALPALILTAGLLTLLLARGGPLVRLGWGVRDGLLAGAAALIPLGPWLLKNLYFFHNALYPTAVRVSAASLEGGGAVAVPHPTLSGHLLWIVTTLAGVLWRFVSPLCLLLPLAAVLPRRPAAWAALAYVLIDGVLWLAFVPYYEPARYWLGPVAISEALMAAVVMARIRQARRHLAVDLALAAGIFISGLLWITTVPFSGPSRQWAMLAIVAQAAIALVVAGAGMGRRLRPALVELPVVSFLCLNGLLGTFIELRELNQTAILAVVRGDISRDAYLRGQVRPYAAEAYINRSTAPGATVVLVGLSRGYYLDRPYLNDDGDVGGRLNRLEQGGAPRGAELASWCRAGVGYALFDRGDNRYDGLGQAAIKPRAAFHWTQTPGLRARLLFSANGLDVLRVTPCEAAGSS